MDANYTRPLITLNRSYDKDSIVSELVGWFSVSGDMDDFIFYDDALAFEAE